MFLNKMVVTFSSLFVDAEDDTSFIDDLMEEQVRDYAEAQQSIDSLALGSKGEARKKRREERKKRSYNDTDSEEEDSEIDYYNQVLATADMPLWLKERILSHAEEHRNAVLIGFMEDFAEKLSADKAKKTQLKNQIMVAPPKDQYALLTNAVIQSYMTGMQMDYNQAQQHVQEMIEGYRFPKAW
jgi:hypothetical protein